MAGWLISKVKRADRGLSIATTPHLLALAQAGLRIALRGHDVVVEAASTWWEGARRSARICALTFSANSPMRAQALRGVAGDVAERYSPEGVAGVDGLRQGHRVRQLIGQLATQRVPGTRIPHNSHVRGMARARLIFLLARRIAKGSKSRIAAYGVENARCFRSPRSGGYPDPRASFPDVDVAGGLIQIASGSGWGFGTPRTKRCG